MLTLFSWKWVFQIFWIVIVFFNPLYLFYTCLFWFCFFYDLALGGQSETAASISLPAAPQLHGVLVPGRFQRHGEVPEEGVLDELTASWNLAQSLKGLDLFFFFHFLLSRVWKLCGCRVVTRRPLTFLLRRRGKTCWKNRRDANRNGFNIPEAQSGKQKRMDTAAPAAATDVWCFPQDRTWGKVRTVTHLCPGGRGGGNHVISCSISRELNWSQSWLVGGFYFERTISLESFLSTLKAAS